MVGLDFRKKKEPSGIGIGAREEIYTPVRASRNFGEPHERTA